MPATKMIGGVWRVVDDETAASMVREQLERFDDLHARTPNAYNRRQAALALEEADRIQTQVENGSVSPFAGRSANGERSQTTFHREAEAALKACARYLEIDGDVSVAWDCTEDGCGGHVDRDQPRVIHLNPKYATSRLETIHNVAHEAWHVSKAIGGKAYTPAEETDAESFARYVQKNRTYHS